MDLLEGSLGPEKLVNPCPLDLFSLVLKDLLHCWHQAFHIQLVEVQLLELLEDDGQLLEDVDQFLEDVVQLLEDVVQLLEDVVQLLEDVVQSLEDVVQLLVEGSLEPDPSLLGRFPIAVGLSDACWGISSSHGLLVLSYSRLESCYPHLDWKRRRSFHSIRLNQKDPYKY